MGVRRGFFLDQAARAQAYHDPRVPGEHMRSVAEYLEKAGEFARMAAKASNPGLKKRYGDLAECYRLLAEERKRLLETGELEPN